MCLCCKRQDVCVKVVKDYCTQFVLRPEIEEIIRTRQEKEIRAETS